MANIKFSQFTEKTTLGTVDFLVGYTGAENVQISPTNLLSTFVSGSGTNGQVAYFDPSNNLTGENAFFWDYTNKRLGIGTNIPNYKVHIKDNSVTTGSKTLLQLQSDPINNGGSLNLDFRVSSANTDDRYVARISGMREGNGALSQLQFWTESSGLYQRMTITSAGNVGIGTNTPSSTLQISGTLDATGISQLGSGGSNVYLTSSSAGNVGIGTSAPGYKLDIYGDAVSGIVRVKNVANGRDTFRSENAAGTRTLNFGNDGSGHGLLLIRNSSGTVNNYITGSGDSYFNGGNVGIGTAFPTGKLEIQNEQVTTQFDRDCFLRLHPSATTDAGGFTNMFFGTSTVNNYGVAIGGLRAGTGDGEPSFSIRMLDDAITGTEVLRIDNPGNIQLLQELYQLQDFKELHILTTRQLVIQLMQQQLI